MPIAEDERRRLLSACQILGTPPDERFDRIAALAADLFNVPIALISLCDGERFWFKSCLGLGFREARGWRFCKEAMRGGPESAMASPDVAADPRFRESPFVLGPPFIGFYAGAVLATEDGVRLGTLCVIDVKPRPAPTESELRRLKTLARMVMDELDLTRARQDSAKQLSLLQMAETMSGVGRWRLELPSRQVSWSDEVYRIHGVDRSRFNPNLDSGIGFYHPEDQAAVSTFVTRAATQGENFNFRLRLTNAAGQLRHVVCKAECEFDASGSTSAIIGVFQDITEQVEQVEELKRSEARYRLLTENSNDLVTEMSPAGIFEYVSPAVLAITGYSPEEAVGTSAMNFIHPDDRERVHKAFDTALKGPSGWRIEYRIVCKNGDTRWVEARPTLARDPRSGKAFAVTDVIRDITERRTMKAALTQSEARYRLLADNVTDVIILVGPDAVIRYVSPSCRAYGYEPDELVGRTTASLIHPDDLASTANSARRLFAGEPLDERVRRDYRFALKDGSYIWIESNPNLILDENGRPSEVLSVFRDVTDRRRMEDDLANAKAQAEAAAAVKTEFLSNMSHELRTPLTSILGFSSLLAEEGGLSGQGRRSVARIAGSGRALLTIVNDILDFSKLESGQVEIEYRSTDPRAMLADALSLLEPQAAAKGVALVLDVDGGLPDQLSMDDGRIRQVLLNLLSNAVKFTDEGAVTLVARYDAGSERLLCKIVDTGPGIPPEGLARLFQRFSQVDASTTRSHGGTGLGLAICKGLIDAMGGELGVESVVGQGSAFWFEVPSATGQKPALAAEITAGDDDALANLNGVRLLVADDNPMNRELIRLMLTPYGVVVTEAASGRDAIRQAQDTAFDLVLMDVRMPDVDGPAAAKAIRESDGPNDLAPIIAFTAEDSESVSHQSWSALFDDQLGKPVLVDQLLAKVAHWSPPYASKGSIDANAPHVRSL